LFNLLHKLSLLAESTVSRLQMLPLDTYYVADKKNPSTRLMLFFASTFLGHDEQWNEGVQKAHMPYMAK
jgi:hypothetical protein